MSIKSTKLRILIIVLILMSTIVLKAQLGFKKQWQKQIVNYGSTQNSKFYSSFYEIDKNKNTYWNVKVADSLSFEGFKFYSREGSHFLIIKCDSIGNIVWIKDFKSKTSNQNTINMKCGNKDELFIYGSFSDSLRIGNKAIYGTTGFICCLDKDGKVQYLKDATFYNSNNIKPYNNGFVYLKEYTTTVNELGTTFNKGLYINYIDEFGNLGFNYLLSQNYGSTYNMDFDMDNEQNLYLTTTTKKTSILELLGKFYKPTDSLKNYADVYLFAIKINSGLQWYRKIDSIGGVGLLPSSVSIDNKNNILWNIVYNKGGNIFGNKLFYQYPGGRYSALCLLNKNGIVRKLYYKDSVYGDRVNYINMERNLLNTISFQIYGSLYNEIKCFDPKIDFNTFTVGTFDTGFHIQKYYINAKNNLNGFPYFTLIGSIFIGNTGEKTIVGETEFTNIGGRDYVIGVYVPTDYKVNNTTLIKPSKFSLYPNPTQGAFNIKSSVYFANPNYKIYTSSGKIVEAKKWQKDLIYINFPGLYFIQFYDGPKYLQTSKIIVQ